MFALVLGVSNTSTEGPIWYMECCEDVFDWAHLVGFPQLFDHNISRRWFLAGELHSCAANTDCCHNCVSLQSAASNLFEWLQMTAISGHETIHLEQLMILNCNLRYHVFLV